MSGTVRALVAILVVAIACTMPITEPTAQQVIYQQVVGRMCAGDSQMEFRKQLVQCPFPSQVIDAVNQEWHASNRATNAVLVEICSPQYAYLNVSPETRATVQRLAGDYNYLINNILIAASKCDTAGMRGHHGRELAILNQIRSTLSADAAKRLMKDAPPSDPKETARNIQQRIYEGLLATGGMHPGTFRNTAQSAAQNAVGELVPKQGVPDPQVGDLTKYMDVNKQGNTRNLDCDLSSIPQDAEGIMNTYLGRTTCK